MEVDASKSSQALSRSIPRVPLQMHEAIISPYANKVN